MTNISVSVFEQEHDILSTHLSMYVHSHVSVSRIRNTGYA